VVVRNADSGALYATSAPDSFFLREYSASIAQEDGSEKEETVNEATSIMAFMKGKPHPHGIRINGGKKQQVIRKFEDEETKQQCVYGKFAQGGSCIVGAGKCVLIATCSETKGHQSAACNEIIHAMAKYLCKSEWPDCEEGSAAAVAASAPPAGDWQQYVDMMLIAKGNISKAVIIAHDGASLAHSEGFMVCISCFSCFGLPVLVLSVCCVSLKNTRPKLHRKTEQTKVKQSTKQRI
jgi:hypothetical protein